MASSVRRSITSSTRAGRGDVDWQRNGETIREEGYSTFLLADEAVHLIEERDAQRPFYLQVSFNAPALSARGTAGSIWRNTATCDRLPPFARR